MALSTSSATLNIDQGSVWTWNVSRRFGPENAAFVNDVVRVSMIQFFIQVMMYLNAPDNNGLFSSEFLVLILFLALAVSFYWLVFRRLLTIR